MEEIEARQDGRVLTFDLEAAKVGTVLDNCDLSGDVDTWHVSTDAQERG